MLKGKCLRYTLVSAFAVGLGLPVIARSAAPTTAPAAAEDPDKVIITVGQEKVTVQDFNDLLSDLPPEAQAMARGQGKRMLGEKLAEIKLLSSEAKRRKLDESPKMKRQMELIRARCWPALAADVKNSIDAAAVQKYYDEHKSEFESVKARHILVRSGAAMPGEQPDAKLLTDEQAKAKIEKIRERLVKGEDFATVAKAESDDKGSAAQGGDLGSFRRNQGLVKPFEDAAFSLKEGEISQPVKTEFGYHIIQVQQKTAGSLESSRKDIENRLAPQKMEQMMSELKKSNPAKLDDSFFGPAMPMPMMMPEQ